MLRFYRPKSFLFLLLCGFVFVVLPLIALLVSTQFFISRLSKESAELAYRSVIGTDQTKKLQEQILSLERRTRQYQIIGSPDLLHDTMTTFVSVIGDLEKIASLPIPYSIQQRIMQLHDGLVSLKKVLQSEKPDSAKLKTALNQFATLNALAREIHNVSSAIIFHQAGRLQKEVSDTSTNLVWQVGGVILLSMLLILIFAHFLTRPVRAIENAIQRLGSGDFATPIRVDGPQDMVFLGERLNWLRQELAAFEKEKSKFTAHVSHELKTPLASIREGAALLMEGGVGNLSAEQQEIAEILGKNAIQLQKLIENLLGYNMALAKSTVINRSTWSMTELVKEILNTIKPVTLKKGLTMDARLDPLEINADRRLLHSVVDNLLSNALKHSPEGGIIHVALFRESGSMILDIADSGPGVAPEDAKRIFEPFFQGKSVSTAPIRGTGLGLAIAREYVAAHGGKLELVPENKAGAHFRITLPLRDL